MKGVEGGYLGIDNSISAQYFSPEGNDKERRRKLRNSGTIPEPKSWVDAPEFRLDEAAGVSMTPLKEEAPDMVEGDTFL